MNLEKSSGKTLWDKIFILAALICVGLSGWGYYREIRGAAGGMALHGLFSPRPSLVVALTPIFLSALASLLALLFSFRPFSKPIVSVLLTTALLSSYFAIPKTEIPTRARRFLELTDLQGTFWTIPEWSESVADLKGLKPDEPAKADIFWLPLSAALAAINSRQWIPVFENNVAVIGLRRRHTSTQNFARVVSYFQRSKLPFDPNQGVELARLYAEKPSWVISFEERTPSTWPSRQRAEHAAITDANYYLSRGIAPRAADRLLEALDESPGNAHLMVRLCSVLMANGEMTEAKKWLERLDLKSLPEELAPTVQEVRYALFEKGLYARSMQE